MTKRPRSLGIRLRVDLDGAHSVGPGKIALLEHIDRSGSLSQAARELDMSYRRAWLLLDDLNHAFAQPVTTASIGGAGGGGARLTPFGRRLVDAFRNLEHDAGELASAQLEWLAGDCAVAHASRTTRQRLTRRLTRAPRVTRAAAPAETPLDTRGRAAKRP